MPLHHPKIHDALSEFTEMTDSTGCPSRADDLKGIMGYVVLIAAFSYFAGMLTTGFLFFIKRRIMMRRWRRAQGMGGHGYRGPRGWRGGRCGRWRRRAFSNESANEQGSDAKENHYGVTAWQDEKIRTRVNDPPALKELDPQFIVCDSESEERPCGEKRRTRRSRCGRRNGEYQELPKHNLNLVYGNTNSATSNAGEYTPESSIV